MWIEIETRSMNVKSDTAKRQRERQRVLNIDTGGL
jgi:hypothetical protein